MFSGPPWSLMNEVPCLAFPNHAGRDTSPLAYTPKKTQKLVQKEISATMIRR